VNICAFRKVAKVRNRDRVTIFFITAQKYDKISRDKKKEG
jgi:hypothetical protein